MNSNADVHDIIDILCDDLDVNECSLGYCHQLRENSPGSYRCFCYEKYTLDSNNRNCSG